VFPSDWPRIPIARPVAFYSIQIAAVRAGANLAQTAAFGDNLAMALSARNQFRGKVASVKTGAVMSEVVIDIGGGHKIVSLISASSAKRLKLKKGGNAIAVIKATEVIISTDEMQNEA
jgi:molybdopterin-binding protein